jgi:hypothetical protein
MRGALQRTHFRMLFDLVSLQKRAISSDEGRQGKECGVLFASMPNASVR